VDFTWGHYAKSVEKLNAIPAEAESVFPVLPAKGLFLRLMPSFSMVNPDGFVQTKIDFRHY
jgi:hypothetical protein